MKITAVIAEYNPFHHGHKHQLEEIRRTQKADYILALMSGNFVQRGAPALCDKFSRAKMALAGGADAVMELPAYWAVSSAENFARGAIALLDALGCIDSLCFGCENPELFTDFFPLLLQAADLFNKETDTFKAALAKYQKTGYSYPAAKAKALSQQLDFPAAKEEFLTKLCAPNNLLGFEYVRAIAYFHSRIAICPILRKGSPYHEKNNLGKYPSASAIRGFLLSQATSLTDCLTAEQAESLSIAIPPETNRIIQETMKKQPLLYENDFSALLHFTLLRSDPVSLSQYYDCSEQLIHRIQNHSGTFLPWTDFCNILKTKNYTYTRISRCLLHILLGIKESDITSAKSDGYACYARILGFRESAKPLLSILKKHSRLPLVTSIARIQHNLPKDAYQMLETDLRASDLYRCIAASLSRCTRTPLPSDYQTSSVIWKEPPK